MSEKRVYIPRYDIFCAQKIIEVNREAIKKMHGWNAVFEYLSKTHNWPQSMTPRATRKACETLGAEPISIPKANNLAGFQQLNKDVQKLATLLITLLRDLGVNPPDGLIEIASRNR